MLIRVWRSGEDEYGSNEYDGIENVPEKDRMNVSLILAAWPDITEIDTNQYVVTIPGVGSGFHMAKSSSLVDRIVYLE